jgi:23S rRNA pseudouridine1911/1915/1917 synthase
LPLKDDITIDKPIGRNPHNRLKQGIVPNGKNAKTNFKKVSLTKDGKYELITAKLYTGRTHQIRVHLESINRHILGDSIYGFQGSTKKFNRVYLHAYNLYFIHPITNKMVNFKIEMPKIMKEILS